MKRLLLKSGFLALLVFGPIVAILFLPLPQESLLSPIFNKTDLLKDDRRDRIIFVGGSGLYLGLDSPRLERRLGRPVVNMGLAAAFGTMSLVKLISPYLRRGDVVVVIPEYGMVLDHYDPVARPFLFALSPARNVIPLYRKEEKPVRTFLIDVRTLVRSKVLAFPRAVRDAVRTGNWRLLVSEGYVDFGRYCNANGDSTRAVRPATSPETIIGHGIDYFTGPDAAFGGQSFAAFNAFCRAAHQRGIAVYFIFPAFPKDEFDLQRRGMHDYEQRLRRELVCPILGRPEDFLFPYGLFTDSVHHLNAEGRRKRTEGVTRLLERSAAFATQRGQVRSAPARPSTAPDNTPALSRALRPHTSQRSSVTTASGVSSSFRSEAA